MPVHWTYSDFGAADNLEQGDILAPTAELRNIFENVHRHFCDDKYAAFLISTQSCDLVPRKGGEPKAGYISIAVIRPLVQVQTKLLTNAIPSVSPGLYSNEYKQRAKELFARIFNQNEQGLGLFYLHEDADAGIAEPSVAFLRVTVALKSDHYKVLQRARTGRVAAEFRAKLGWLLGNLYGRPATPDWDDRPNGAQQLTALISQFVQSDSNKDNYLGPQWIDKEIVEAAQKAKVSLLRGYDSQTIEGLRPKPRIDLAVEEVAKQLQILAPELGVEIHNKFRNRLLNNSVLVRLLKPT